MLNFLRKMMLIVAFAAVGVCVYAIEAKPTRGMIRVKLQPEVALRVGQQPRMQSKGVLSVGIDPLDRAAQETKTVKMRRMLPYNAKFEAQRAKYGLDRWYVIEFDESVDPQTARAVYGNAAGVERSEVIMPMELKEGNGRFITAKAPGARPAINMPFNDPRLGDQWHYYNTGRLANSVAGADINLFEAWAKTTGSRNVVVAIIDGGVDYKHEDLAANMFVNEAELNGTPGVDDDGNGYVDDIYGYNFCTNSAEIYPHNHGTHVAGTVAAVNNNGIGVAGVAGGDGSKDSGVRMLSCQVFDSRSGTSDGDFAAAIVYACEMGATIAQCSWGWATAGYYEQAVLDAIDYFTETARSDNMTGGLCIFAAGNMGETGNWYPGCVDKVLCVGAMTADLAPASYSNYGPWVDIMAPGGLLDYGESGGVLSTLPNNSYGYNEGTSMATPHVSGIAALVLSKYGSPSFVNESLRTQLLTSVNDFYGYGNNAKYEGNYGVGYIDAAKALNMGTGEAPAAVTDLRLDAAQDYIDLTWTVPASSDNNVNNHIVYFSTEPFTAAELSKAQSRVVDTKFLSSGDVASYELTGLQSKTTYYVAIAAVNRWGTASPLSQVVSVTTNDGPAMTVVTPSVLMEANADNHTATGTITIGNEGEGLLKWSAGKRTVSVQTMNVARPMPGNIGKYNGQAAGTTLVPYSRATAEYDASDYPSDIANYSTIWAYIGDNDRSLPNSMAQWFKVDASKYPDGFNLTHLKVDGYNGKNPKIEIYRGDVAISSATKLLDVDYSFFVYGWPIALNEQLYFAPGESFWIVVHFDGDQEGYPLGMALANEGTSATYSYMSNDYGKTWTPLTQALAGSSYANDGNTYTWGITARMANPDWSELVELTPANGTVRTGETQDITASVDGTKLVNGTYNFNVLISNNEGKGKTVSVPATLSVGGNAHDVVMPKVVDFGSLLVGQSKTMTVEAYNRGFGSLRGSDWGASLYEDNISSSSEHFAGPSYMTAGFPARTKTTFEVTYTPQSAGSHTGAITFTDKDGKAVRVLVQGSATEPAKLAVDPAVIDAGTLTVGAEPTEATFAITNEGKYPLEFVFPKFSDEQIDGATAANHKYGYTVASNIEGYNEFAYDGNPALIGGTNIASKFTDNSYISEAIPMGFQFPYYGKSYEKVYISSYGVLMFALPEADVNFWNPLTATSESIRGTAMISAYGNKLAMNNDSRVSYAKQDGKFVVKFENVLATVYGDDYTPISFHIVLSANGDIEMHYDSYSNREVFQDGSVLFCGVNDPDLADCLTVTSADMADYWGVNEPTADNRRFQSFAAGTAVKFEAPKPSFVTALAPAAGLVAPGETVQVTATLAANNTLNAGETYNNLAVVTNDPKPAVSAVRINAVIAGDELVAVAELDKSDINFGKVFRTAEVLVPVTVKNVGHDALTITSVTAANGVYSYSIDLPVEVAAGMSKDIVLTVPTATEGAVADALTIETSAGTLVANVAGTVIGCPGLDLSFDEVMESVLSGEPLSKTLTITNNGNETLVYSVSPNALYNLTVPDKADSATAYAYASATDDSNVKYEWVDIETTGLGTQNALAYYLAHDYVEVELPFEFPFYGKKYSKMYIYNTGFVSFTKRNDDKLWPEPPGDFPEGTVYNNLIAPYWGLHAMDQTATAGTYHYVTDDRAVISWMEYGNSMNLGVCFQLIMHKDGKFTFQYKGLNEESIIYNLFGLAGISNDDSTQSVRLPERMVKFNNAVDFNPVVAINLPAGQSDEVTFDFDTNRMAGMYNTEITLTTNVPGAENVQLPVMLQITGQAQPTFPESVEVEHVMYYQSQDWNDPLVQMGAAYTAPFKVENPGTAAFTIMQINVGGPQIYDEWFDEYTPAFFLFYNGPELDWITGEPTGNYAWMQYDGYSPVPVDNKGIEFSVPMIPNEFWATPGEYEIPIQFYCYNGSIMDYMMDDDPEEKFFMAETTVKFTVTPPPYMIVDREEVYVKADTDDFSTVETVNIANYGDYKLTYELVLDPTGEGEPVDPGFGGDPGIEPLAAATKAVSAQLGDNVAVKSGILPFDRSDNVYNAPAGFEYLDALFHAAMPGTTGVYNYGSGNLYDTFKAATAFKAPEEGFNISHIYTPVTIWTNENVSAKNVDIKVSVVKGTDPAGDVVLGRGNLHMTEQSTPQGQFFVIPLDRATYIEPGEEFCVVISYPAGIEAPAYLVAKEEAVVTGRYQAYQPNYGWYDLGELFKDNYGSLGYICSCIETVKGESWIKLLNAETSGAIEPGEALDVQLKINAASARLDQGNKAMLVVKSNDMYMPVLNIPVVLDKNAAPVVEGPEGIVYAREGQTTIVSLKAYDPDFETFTLRFDDANGNARLAGVEAHEGDMATVTANQDGTYTVEGATEPVAVNVQITPEFGSAASGLAFTVTANDAAGHETQLTVNYAIEHVNRAPEALTVDEVVVLKNQLSNVINFADLFSDPDGDDLTFEFALDDNTLVDAFTMTTGVVFHGKKVGRTTATVTATDPSGEKAVCSLPIFVNEDDGVADITVENGFDADATYFNLQGVRIAEPAAGIYIKLSGLTATKVLIK